MTVKDSIIKNKISVEKEAQLQKLEKKRKELLTKLKAKKQKLTSLNNGIESYRASVYEAFERGRNTISLLQAELKVLFKELRKAKLLNSEEKKVLREMEMEFVDPVFEEDKETKNNKKQKAEHAKQEEADFIIEDVPEVSAVENRQLRKVYLRLASKFHPDKSDAAQSEKYHELMLQINAAYKSGDIAALLEIENKYKDLGEITSGVYGTEGFLKVRTEQLELEIKLLAEQFEKVKTSLAEVEKSQLGKMYKNYIQIAKVHPNPMALATQELRGTIVYMTDLKNSIVEFLETGVMPEALEKEFYPDEYFDMEDEDMLSMMFEMEEEEQSQKKRR